MDNASSSKPVILGLCCMRFRLDICLSLLRSIHYLIHIVCIIGIVKGMILTIRNKRLILYQSGMRIVL
ncbi:hypothetical protein HOS23_gp58 [Rhizobium phage RHEph09]|uniref:Uncharacterized protein n=1 Tax=Rhizobium phage RHEph09 TaxID=1220716 RepID=L7TS65_9CAUD|nr:hypothetical protein HOS23_gp58 [Rhizobium phage RHEph09]AGC36041.1 hypothetical protein RHEph09_gp058 [Rhizobium phage RHEph09]